MIAVFAPIAAASSTAKPIGTGVLALIFVLSFGVIGVTAIMVTTWLDRHRHSQAALARRTVAQEEKARVK